MNNSPSVKKGHVKSQLYVMENMKEYLDNNTLNKLTTAHLHHWLKERSIQCAAREKKESLIEKVRKHFEDNMSESEKEDKANENDESSLEIDTSMKKNATANKDDNVTPKKVRSKPQPQIIENMKEYLENDTLSQLTTTTLRHWLKEKSISCTTREKKDSLIQKIHKYFLESSA